MVLITEQQKGSRIKRVQTKKRERLVSIVQMSVIKQPGIAVDINYREGGRGIKIKAGRGGKTEKDYMMNSCA